MTIPEFIAKIDANPMNVGEMKHCYGIDCANCPVHEELSPTNAICTMKILQSFYHKHRWCNKINELL